MYKPISQSHSICILSPSGPCTAKEIWTCADKVGIMMPISRRFLGKGIAERRKEQFLPQFHMCWIKLLLSRKTAENAIWWKGWEKWGLNEFCLMHIQVNTLKKIQFFQATHFHICFHSFPVISHKKKKSSAFRMNNQEIKIRHGTKWDTSLCKSWYYKGAAGALKPIKPQISYLETWNSKLFLLVSV